MRKVNNKNRVVNQIMSFPRVVGGNLPLIKSFIKKEKQPRFTKSAVDPRQKPSGMTLNFMGFTLIELLVAVLIIGILAAIAVPQYQVAVGKARFMELVAIGDALHKAEEAYYLANGSYTGDMDALSLEQTTQGQVRKIILDASGYVALESKGLDNYYIFYVDQHTYPSFRRRRECRVDTNKLNSTNRKICAAVTGGIEYPTDAYSFWIFQK